MDGTLSMKKDTKKTPGKTPLFPAAIFYCISAIGIFVYELAVVHPRLQLGPAQQLLLLALFCICFYSGSRSLCRMPGIQASRCMKITFFIFFLLYLQLLFTFTLFEPAFGRRGAAVTLFSDPKQWRLNLKNACNLLPFSTVSAYLKAYFSHNIRFSVVATNLFGNLLALAPMALFLPLLFKRCRRFFPFLLTVSAIVLCIELLQLIFMVGSFDVDDLILNDLGACLLFWILKCRPVNRWLRSVTYMQ